MKKYELPLSPTYVRDWGVPEAVRELVQNAIDGEDQFPMELEVGNGFVRIANIGASLSPRQLVLGNTSKADNPKKIGSFGEGFKLALLVLCRIGIPVKITNGDVEWLPRMAYSEEWQSEILEIEERPSDSFGPYRLEFVVGGLDINQITDIKETCLILNDKQPQRIKTADGDILFGLPGKIFVNGLFVANAEGDFRFGYDFPAASITLDRDRRTVSSFDLSWEAARAWLLADRPDLVASLLEAQAPDVGGLEYHSFQSAESGISDTCYERHQKRHGKGVFVVGSQEEATDMDKRGLRYVYEPRLLSKTIRSSRLYQEDVKAAEVKRLTPTEELSEWYNKNKGRMPRLRKVEFKVLIEKSKEWKLK